MTAAVYTLNTPPSDEYPALNWRLRTNSNGAATLLEIDKLLRAGAPPEQLIGPEFTLRGNLPDLLSVVPGLAVSARARNTLECIRVPGLRFLPLTVNMKPYSIIYTTRVLDCLDLERSDLSYFRSNPTRVKSIAKYVFRAGVIREFDIFTLPQQADSMFVWSHPLYVTEGTRKLIQDAGLEEPFFTLRGTTA